METFDVERFRSAWHRLNDSCSFGARLCPSYPPVWPERWRTHRSGGFEAAAYGLRGDGCSRLERPSTLPRAQPVWPLRSWQSASGGLSTRRPEQLPRHEGWHAVQTLCLGDRPWLSRETVEQRLTHNDRAELQALVAPDRWWREPKPASSPPEGQCLPTGGGTGLHAPRGRSPVPMSQATIRQQQHHQTHPNHCV